MKKLLLCAAMLAVLSGCGYRHNGVIIHKDPGTTVVVNESTEYLTYRERYGGYTMTPHGYIPFHRSGNHFIRTSTPGYTWSKSVYWDQRPEAFGIYPVRRTEVHVVTSGLIKENVDYARAGCAVNERGEPYLREYTTEVEVGGEKVPAYGTACRQPDNDWKLISDWHLKGD